MQSDLLGWLSHCEQLFAINEHPEDENVDNAPFHLERDGQVLFLKLEQDKKLLQHAILGPQFVAINWENCQSFVSKDLFRIIKDALRTY